MKYLSDARYRMALVRMRHRIATGLILSYEDSETIGEKGTKCSWGMCSEDVEQWPDAGDHLFPVVFMDRGRVSVVRRADQPCPLEIAALSKPSEGCFYRCRVFQQHLGALPTRDAALRLYNSRIQAVGDHLEVCGCDNVGEIVDPVGGKKKLPCPTCRREDYSVWRLSYKREWT